ncbi:uncharacterized protein LOC100278691 [Zea mays]|uniref:Uncharacterized protein n=1 Tax=Zea mays TaxID=4577 RepID=B6UCB4_MAIZE|nr:uncharacterized protein LOC100278691 [Zea mays]ACG46997.1 hypothetical protein [Zea mays]
MVEAGAIGDAQTRFVHVPAMVEAGAIGDAQTRACAAWLTSDEPGTLDGPKAFDEMPPQECDVCQTDIASWFRCIFSKMESMS